MVKRIIHFLLLPCSEATMFIEKKQAGMLSPLQKLRLNAHIRICKWCKAYNSKVLLLDKKMANKIKEIPPNPVHERDLELLKNKIREKIKQ